MKYELQIKKVNKATGYTIIETMIAVSLFIVIVMIGMGALISANATHNKSRDMRSIMDSLSFVIEDMSRSLRTGSNYRCVSGNLDSSLFNTPQSGVSCWAIAFEPENGSAGTITDQWVYFLTLNASGNYAVWKSVNGLTNIIQITPNEVAINPTSSFISVSGAEPPPGDTKQPFVTVRLNGTVTYKGVVTPFSLQTSVSQRSIDI